jgi:hypothetical protein
MNRARSFFFVCLGILALALAYHFGATTATAQAPGNPVVGIACGDGGYTYHAVTANGDHYTYSLMKWQYAGNLFGSATPAQSISIGQLKAKYATPAGK